MLLTHSGLSQDTHTPLFHFILDFMIPPENDSKKNNSLLLAKDLIFESEIFVDILLKIFNMFGDCENISITFCQRETQWLMIFPWKKPKKKKRMLQIRWKTVTNPRILSLQNGGGNADSFQR